MRGNRKLRTRTLVYIDRYAQIRNITQQHKTHLQ